MNNPVFIVGAPRSGTTFLASLLEGSSYGAPFETHFITKYYKKLSSYGDLTKLGNFRRLLGEILRERPIMQWKASIDVDQLYKELQGNINYANLVDALCKKLAATEGANNWGDKTPTYLMDLGIIYELFPNAKYLHITRDGRDVALSLLQKSWGPNNVYSCAEYWSKYYQDTSTLDEISRKGSLYQIRYEDLLDNIETETLKIYEFIGEDSSGEKTKQAVKKVKKGNYFKWKSLMTSEQIKVFESVAGPTLKSLGYEVGTEHYELPQYKKTLYSLHNKLLLAKHLFIINIVDGFKIRFLGKEPFAE